MLVIGSAVFLGACMVGMTIYASYRVFGSLTTSWSLRGFLLLWLPVLGALLVAVAPISYVTFDGYRDRESHQRVVTQFLEDYPETQQLVRADRGEAWIFGYMNDGGMHTTLLVGGQYLDIEVTAPAE